MPVNCVLLLVISPIFFFFAGLVYTQMFLTPEACAEFITEQLALRNVVADGVRAQFSFIPFTTYAQVFIDSASSPDFNYFGASGTGKLLAESAHFSTTGLLSGMGAIKSVSYRGVGGKGGHVKSIVSSSSGISFTYDMAVWTAAGEVHLGVFFKELNINVTRPSLGDFECTLQDIKIFFSDRAFGSSMPGEGNSLTSRTSYSKIECVSPHLQLLLEDAWHPGLSFLDLEAERGVIKGGQQTFSFTPLDKLRVPEFWAQVYRFEPTWAPDDDDNNNNNNESPRWGGPEALGGLESGKFEL